MLFYFYYQLRLHKRNELDFSYSLQIEMGEEEARLRDKAIKTLDLRNRIDNKIGGQVRQMP